MKRYEVQAIIVVVALAVALLLVLGADPCGAGNCTSHKWQQSTANSCKCWYKNCDGKCDRAGTWNGNSLTCACPVIGSCGGNVAASAAPTPVPYVQPAAPAPTAPLFIASTPIPNSQINLPSVKTCKWYSGLDPTKEMVAGEIRKDWTTGTTWKCLADGTTIKLKDNLNAEEILVIQRKTWPGGFMGCRSVFGAGWHLSKGDCIKVMKVCVYGGGQEAVVGARDSCENY